MSKERIYFVDVNFRLPNNEIVTPAYIGIFETLKAAMNAAKAERRSFKADPYWWDDKKWTITVYEYPIGEILFEGTDCRFWCQKKNSKNQRLWYSGCKRRNVHESELEGFNA